jgi:hypothetical protein
MEAAEKKYAVVLWKESGREPPLEYMASRGEGRKTKRKGGQQRFYLETHVQEVAAEEHGSVQDAMTVANLQLRAMMGNQSHQQKQQANCASRRNNKDKGPGKGKGRQGKQREGDRRSWGHGSKKNSQETNSEIIVAECSISCLSLVDSDSDFG